MTVRELPVKATLVMNFGKFDYVYKPLDARGEKMLQMVIASSNKPESKRTNFTKSDIVKAINLTKPHGIELQFIAAEVNSPAAPTPPELGKPISFGQEQVAQVNLDMGFLA